MPVYSSYTILSAQMLYKTAKRHALIVSARIRRSHAVSLHATYIGHAYRPRVVALAMRPGSLYFTTTLHSAIEFHNVVVTNTRKTAGTVPAVNVGHAHLAPARGSSAVHDNHVNLSHNVSFSRKITPPTINNPAITTHLNGAN